MIISGFLVLLFISLVHFYVLKKLTSGNLFKSLSIISIIKIFSSLFFTAYYIEGNSDPMSADVFKYFHDADVLFQTISTNPLIYFKILLGIDIQDPEIFYYLNKTEFYFHGGNHWTNDDHLMIKLNMFIRLISFGNIYVHSLLFGLFSFWASLYFIRTIEHSIQIPKSMVYCTTYLIPSVLFWSSGALKETLLISALFIAIGIIFYKQHIKITHWFLLAFSIFIVFSIRPALLICFLGGILLTNIYIRLQKYALLAIVVLICSGILTLFFVPEISGLIINKRNELIETAIKVNAATLVNTQILTPNTIEFIKIIPTSFFYGLTEPLVWKSYPYSARLFGLEIILICVFTIIFIDFKKVNDRSRKVIGMSLLWGSLLYIFIIGLTTPVAGAITRYRSIVLPIILFGIYELFILKLFIYNKIKRFDAYFEN